MNQKLIAWLIDSITEDEKELNGVKLFQLPIDSQVDLFHLFHILNIMSLQWLPDLLGNWKADRKNDIIKYWRLIELNWLGE